MREKTKVEVVRDILRWVAIVGVVAISASSPYFIRNLLRAWSRGKRYKQKSVETAFQRLRKKGLIIVEKKNHEYHVSLTESGKKKTELLHIDSLAITTPKKWDGNWRVLLFDVEQAQRWKRDVLRGFLRRLGFVQFQKSVWVHPYDCKTEVELLQKFLGLTSREVKLLIVHDVGEDEKWLHKTFHLLSR